MLLQHTTSINLVSIYYLFTTRRHQDRQDEISYLLSQRQLLQEGLDASAADLAELESKLASPMELLSEEERAACSADELAEIEGGLGGEFSEALEAMRRTYAADNDVRRGEIARIDIQIARLQAQDEKDSRK
jgi:hypothetical protein